MNKNFLCAVLCFNNEKIIQNLIDDLIKSEKLNKIEKIFIDDNSSDKTISILKKNNLTIIEHNKNGPSRVVHKVPKDYFKKLADTDVVLNAIIRKTQVRLIDANKKTNQLAMEVTDLLSSIKDKGGEQNELSQRISNLKKKITEINKANND